MELQPVYIHVICIMDHFVHMLMHVRIRMRTGSRCTHCVHGLTIGLIIQTRITAEGGLTAALLLAHTNIYDSESPWPFELLVNF